jgi:DNA-binding SARP family transcriptional activator/pimeloyl-ACP methyl ester carboxylesterase
MPQLKLLLFGPPRLTYQGENVDISLRKAMALLAYMVATRGKFSRDDLATLFWPESDQSGARANLRRTLYQINKNIGENIFCAGDEIIELDPNIDIWTDIEAFRQKISTCAPLDAHAQPLDPECIAKLEQAVALFRGDFLAGFSLPDSPQFDEWQFFEAESLRSSLAAVLRQLVTSCEFQADYEPAIQHARRWISLDALHEPAHRLLMRVYEKSGQHAAALRQYKECERILEQELGVSPEPKTTELYQNILLRRETNVPKPAAARPEVRYVASGEVQIAYVEMGEGPVDILWVLGYVTHMEHMWELPALANFFQEQASYSRVILFDRRGVGLSERIGYPPTLEDTLDDTLAVMRATGAKHPVLIGYLEGGPNCMLFAATYPERLSGLVLYGTRAKWTRSDDYPWMITREQYDSWLNYVCENWGEPHHLNHYAPSRAHDPELQEWWAKFVRLASSPMGIKAVLEVMRDIDVRHILPAISTPTLIIARKDDKVTRAGAARHLASQIPGARYVELEGQDHWPFMGDSQSILREIKKFVQNIGSPQVPERMLATIMLIELLDTGSSEALSPTIKGPSEPIHALVRREVRRYRGCEVSWRKHVFTATFDGPSRAIHCTKTILEAARQQEVPLRVGLHTGECEFMAGELSGSAVQIAERVLKNAGANEALASSTVKDLVLGAGFRFSERAKCAIEGIFGEWRMFSLE